MTWLRKSRIKIVLVDAQDEGAIFLDQKEEYVKQIALSAGMLDGNCNLLDNCPSECTRAVCYPRKEDLQAECVRVDLNNICLPTEFNKSCDHYMKLNYQRSYLTLPPPANPQQLLPEMARDICSLRGLDTTFKTISSNKEFSYVYFGSLSGVFRAFPGRERPANRCTTFETRRRPWFKNGNSVQKQLRIVVDTGNSMGSQVPPNYPPAAGATFLQVASNIILQLLKTVSPDDYVDVGLFNSSGYRQLSPMVQISAAFDGAAGSNELAGMEASVARNLTRSSSGLPSNLTAAILNVVDSFKQTTTETLKVIVIFTDGQFLPLNASTFPTARILELKVKIILYKLPRQYDADPFLMLTTFPSILCNARGSFELLEPSATSNPLFSIRSFYTFLAQIHLAVAKNQSTWSNRYVGASQALNGTTVTYPDGQLIGIAGIDVFPEELDGDLGDLVLTALGNRSALGYLPGTFADVNFACSYQTAVRSGDSCSASAPPNGGICEATDTTTALPQRVCCDSCFPLPPPPAPPSDPPGINKVVVLGASVGSVACVALLVASLICCLCFRDGCGETAPYPPNPPPDSRTGSMRREHVPSLDKVPNTTE